MKRALIHIGPHKTGSTYIQQMMKVNADLFPDTHAAYPKSDPLFSRPAWPCPNTRGCQRPVPVCWPNPTRNPISVFDCGGRGAIFTPTPANTMIGSAPFTPINFAITNVHLRRANSKSEAHCRAIGSILSPDCMPAFPQRVSPIKAMKTMPHQSVLAAPYSAIMACRRMFWTKWIGSHP